MDHLLDEFFRNVTDKGTVVGESPNLPTLNQKEILEPLTNQISSNLTPEQNKELVELRKMKNAKIGSSGGLELDSLDNVAEKKLVWLELKAMGILVSSNPPVETLEPKSQFQTPRKQRRQRT